MQIVFCDNHLLVVIKPAGMSVQPHKAHEPNLTDQAKQWVKKEFHKAGNVFLEPVHRLDKPVSGLVLFARTSKALSRLHELMRSFQIEKIYIALVEGILPEKQGALEHFLVHDEHKARLVSSSHKEGKSARLHYRVLKENNDQSLVEITLITGRYHQIRAQFAALHCPIWGDVKYESREKSEGKRICLHQSRLKFVHPVTKELLELEAPLSSFGK